MTDGPAAQPGLERLAAVQQNLLKALERTRQEGAQAADAQQALARISGRASSPDDAITVVVDSSGAPQDVTFTEKISERSPQQLGAELMHCLRQAQAQLGQAFADQAGDDPFAARIAAKFEERYPAPEPDPDTAGQVNEVALGQLDEEPAPTTAPPPRPRREGNDEDFGETDFLRGPDRD
ncbi:YbaB/EbfC family nucleoid-associated protein [Amycolatopsis jiangsuensis]|uniref:DNA-binding protein YbaB n=1 Tax=Amycolatopsis jiangsuensis TaxID=1181879 RepID=A0A840J788_9PSEU|nr:YbaB/EbfC family nucleoid-associated protein [Amycolatopsis jiangsuensis]MBB4689465.1 DNA-binding protein YbaB [Amycolatopsis jiangsuensis]